MSGYARRPKPPHECEKPDDYGYGDHNGIGAVWRCECNKLWIFREPWWFGEFPPWWRRDMPQWKPARWWERLRWIGKPAKSSAKAELTHRSL